MKYKARKSGNSIAVTIPTFICSNLDIKDGDNVDIKMQGRKIVIEKEENK